jgi:transposase
MTVRNLTVPSPTTADPELSERAQASRRSFSAREKLRVLAAVDAAAGHDGAIGAILRREGLYSSILSRWRRQRDTGVLAALTPAKRGPSAAVPKPQTKELVQLRRDNARLQKRLKQAETIISVQKKVAELLAIELDEPEPDGKS